MLATCNFSIGLPPEIHRKSTSPLVLHFDWFAVDRWAFQHDWRLFCCVTKPFGLEKKMFVSEGKEIWFLFLAVLLTFVTTNKTLFFWPSSAISLCCTRLDLFSRIVMSTFMLRTKKFIRPGRLKNECISYVRRPFKWLICYISSYQTNSRIM